MTWPITFVELRYEWPAETYPPRGVLGAGVPVTDPREAHRVYRRFKRDLRRHQRHVGPPPGWLRRVLHPRAVLVRRTVTVHLGDWVEEPLYDSSDAAVGGAR